MARNSLCMLLCLLIEGVLAPAQDSQPVGKTTSGRPTTKPSSQPTLKNLVANGDFEIADESGKLPAGWTTKHPDNVRLVNLGDFAGRVVEMAGGRKLMASYGIDLTSGRIPIEANTRYRCSGYTKSGGPKMKVFIKGYATVTRRVKGESRTFDEVVYQMRKDIEPSEDWQPFQLEFEITPAEVFSDFQHQVAYVRIRLWAFWPAGTCWFDDICFEKVGPVVETARRHEKAVTHVGLPPRLGESATQPAKDAADESAFDEQQTWRDAVNAFRTHDYEQAVQAARRLLTYTPHKGAYHVLAARALAELRRWEEAEQHARWLMEDVGQAPDENATPREIERWQRDWARIVLARVYQHTGRAEQARAALQELLQAEPSPHARAAAERLLTEIDKADEQGERKP
jgi:hypothetical protein